MKHGLGLIVTLLFSFSGPYSSASSGKLKALQAVKVPAIASIVASTLELPATGGVDSTQLFDLALQKYRKNLDKSGEIATLLHQSQYYITRKMFNQAGLSLDLVKLLLVEHPSESQLLVYTDLSATLEAAQGDFQSAFLSSQRANRLRNEFPARQRVGEAKQVHAYSIKNAHQPTNTPSSATFLLIVSLISLVAGLALIMAYWSKSKAYELLHARWVLLEKENAELNRLNQLKNRLFSILAHDLRSPLNNLTGVLSLVGDGLLDHKEVQSLTDKLTVNVKETTNFLDNLLMWTRSQMDGIQAQSKDIDLHLLVRETLEVYSLQAEEKKLKIINQIPEQVYAYADLEMIRIILRNLLSNAIKFSLEGGTIQVSAFAPATADFLTVSIEDEGIGIEKELHTRLFGQGNYTTTGTHDEKGTGIGLLLCRDLVERNGGKIWLKSTPNKGSVFEFTLPQLHLAKRDEGIKNLLADIL